jgi:Mg-chelatase subunit ChlD
LLQQRVREGKTSALVTMEFLVTLASVSMEGCERMAAAFA